MAHPGGEAVPTGPCSSGLLTPLQITKQKQTEVGPGYETSSSAISPREAPSPKGSPALPETATCQLEGKFSKTRGGLFTFKS